MYIFWLNAAFKIWNAAGAFGYVRAKSAANTWLFDLEALFSQSEKVFGTMKQLKNLKVVAVERLRADYGLVRLTDPDAPLPPIAPGQFVEVRVAGAPHVFLRRPISVNFVERDRNELWLLVHAVGEGTRALCDLSAGDTLDCLFPLGRGFSLPESKRVLLVGGGVGCAPLLYLGSELKRVGSEPTFLLGGRTGEDLLQLDLFEKIGRVCLTTEDGSRGTQGFVTNHAAMQEPFDLIQTCGPKPMMMAVARVAKERGIPCEASLENLMACGVGACLCCVEKTTEGHRCVCTDGPVFRTEDLLW